MIDVTQARFQTLSIHYAGNKNNGDQLILSTQPIDLTDDSLRDDLLQYFLIHFRKPEYYRFHHTEDVKLNTVYHLCDKIFSGVGDVHETTQGIARYLYDKSIHPNIRGGEVYVAHFRSLILDGDLMDAIGIFKTESKSNFFKVYNDDGIFSVAEDIGISDEKLDKGCLIFNTKKAEGYRVSIIDNTNKSEEARYWRDDFLGLAVANDDYHKTQNMLTMTKNFIKEQMPEEFAVETTEQIAMLNKSVEFFKKHEQFDFQEFATEVMQAPAVKESFERYKQTYEQDTQTRVHDQFDISDTAVKKQQRIFKSVLKLDKNFHIYIHGDRELIEKGYDPERNMNFYKVYFRDETSG
ncbi:MAG: nucleoid-associated protein [Bacteroidetes bacterium]|nr:nucleoid-associated protein [Bacteroidota bacterium]